MFALLCLLALPIGGMAQSQARRPESALLAQSTQIIVVLTSGWDEVDGRLQRYERRTLQQAWQPVGEAIPIVVGRNGMGWGLGLTSTSAPELRTASGPIKHEGDGRAPAGIFTLGTAFGYAPQPLPASKLPYLPLTPSSECVDDVASIHYNRIIDCSAVTLDWKSSEHMRSAGESYRWGIVVNHNAHPPAPGGGSCIFLHIWKGSGQGTAGCTAMPQSELEGLLTWLDPKRNPLLVQLPKQEYESLKQRWKLPPIPTAPGPQTSH